MRFATVLVAPVVAAADEFVVHNIQVHSLQRIQYSTVISYLPIHIGQQISNEDTANIIRVLYKTQFFSNVELGRSGDTLIINVQERSVIGSINFVGVKDIPRTF